MEGIRRRKTTVVGFSSFFHKLALVLALDPCSGLGGFSRKRIGR
jgi:hypothetical protein